MYFHYTKCSDDLLATLTLWSCSEFWWWNVDIHFVSYVFIYSLLSLLASNGVSALFFMVFKFWPYKLTSAEYHIHFSFSLSSGM